MLMVLAAGAAMLACSSPVEAPRNRPDFEGQVETASVGYLRGTSELVGHLRIARVGDTLAHVHVPAEAEILVREGPGELRPGTMEELASAGYAVVWTTGVELRSFPPQYAATRVVIR